MEQIIYGDILFLINFSMDFLSLYIAGKIMGFKQRAWRLTLSAILGGVYSIAALFIKNNLPLFLSNILTALIMCLIAYKVYSIASYLCNTLIFFGVNLFLGGMMTAVFTFIGKYANDFSIGGENGVIYGKIPLPVFFTTAAACTVLAYLLGYIMKGKINEEKAWVGVFIDGKSIKINCILDSGNLLCEPIGGLPVIIIGRLCAQRIIPKALFDMICGTQPSEYCQNTENMRRLRIIPTSTVGNSGVIYGVLTDKVEIYNKNGKKKYEKAAVIAVDIENDRFGECDGILPSVLVN